MILVFSLLTWQLKEDLLERIPQGGILEYNCSKTGPVPISSAQTSSNTPEHMKPNVSPK